MKRLFVFLASLLGISGAAVVAQKGPSFAHVSSREIAEELVGKGELVRMPLFPVEFGGDESPQNLTYVPPWVLEIRAPILGTLEKLIREGTVDKLTVKPTYNGDSFVPCRVTMSASHSEKSGGFEPTLEIWSCD